MTTLQESMAEFKEQLAKGAIQQAYQGLMQYMLGLRTHFEGQYPDYFISGLYNGYMDMTYFSIVPPTLKDRKLKIAVVFVYQTFRFEVWLAAVNKQVQSSYWKLIRESGWKKYALVPSTKGADAILEHVLAEDANFGDTEALTKQLEAPILKFIRDVENFLSGQKD